MSSTLTYKDSIERTGYSVIDGVKVVQYTMTIPSDNPDNMKIIRSILDKDLYKANRETCRADFAAFEDEAYLLQDEYLAKVNSTEEDV